MKKTLSKLSAVLLGLGVLPGLGSAQTYKFDVPEKLVNIAFESRMELEDILGSSNQASGEVTRAKDGQVSFHVKVPVTSLKTGIALRDEHLGSSQWLDAKRFPSIELKGSSARKLGKDKWRISGTFTLRGVSKPLVVDVTVTEIPAAVAAKAGLERVSWIRVRGEFKVKLSDHGLKVPSMLSAKVADVWTVRVSLFAKESK
ncbi:MAG: YceI family protein [Polyangia bacterium]|jgi:polyisoprenoid-binding protein YceI|nr:YceI family protein [Polyangia bacterium]